MIEGNNESPPLVCELLQGHYGKKVMFTMDLTHGYWQVPLSIESRPYTAFLYGSTLYQFCRVPFGLKTAGSGFIRALNLALGNEFAEFLVCYIDDLLVVSKDFRDHVSHLDKVFDRLLRCNFTLRLSISQNFVDRSYLFWDSCYQARACVLIRPDYR